jgi:hypothetical protein
MPKTPKTKRSEKGVGSAYAGPYLCLLSALNGNSVGTVLGFLHFEFEFVADFQIVQVHVDEVVRMEK